MEPQFKLLPRFYVERKISRKYWQGVPPIFPDGNPSGENIKLARDLYRELDRHTQAWYGRLKLFADIYEEIKGPDPSWYDKRNE